MILDDEYDWRNVYLGGVSEFSVQDFVFHTDIVSSHCTAIHRHFAAHWRLVRLVGCMSHNPLRKLGRSILLKDRIVLSAIDVCWKGRNRFI